MKNAVCVTVNRYFLSIIFTVIFSAQVFSTPDYVFANPEHKTGTYLAVGSVYRFYNVKPGTDALVTIKSFSGGISLYSLDETWTGFGEAFQPFINVPPGSDGYVEFEFHFVSPNTTNSKNQAELPITCIDVDGLNFGNGNGIIYEQDQIELKTGYYDFSVSSPLLMVNPQTEATDTWLTGKNMSGQFIDGIDTSEKQVMFTVINANVSKVRVRIGARNTSTTHSDVRYRSVYFMKFNYPDAFLANGPLMSFNAHRQPAGVKMQWSLDAQTQFSRLELEKSADSRNWVQLTAVSVASGTTANGTVNFNYTDAGSLSEKNYYRLKLIANNGQFIYSNIVWAPGDDRAAAMKIYPAVVTGNASMLITAERHSEAQIRIIGAGGQMVYQKNIEINTGENHIPLGFSANIAPGLYTAQVVLNGQPQTARFIKTR